MRLLRTLAPLACVLAVVQMAHQPPAARSAGKRDARMRMMPGPQDVLYAAVGDANYAYGPSMRQINQRMAALTANAQSATFQVTYDSGFMANAPAQAAFQAAINIWSTVVTSPAGIPIKVNAKFDSNFSSSSVLGSAGPTVVCNVTGGVAGTFFAAALANVRNNNSNCADSSGFEISAHFNSSFSNWDFGTSGTPVSGKYSFATVVLHEVGHGLGFYGSMQSSGGVGSHFYDAAGAPGAVDIWDRFITIGTPAGASIILVPSPSTALGADLISNNLFFDGASTKANNSGSAGKIESHDFSIAFPGSGDDHGFLQGSSYSHVDDVLYSRTPNGLMTWQLNAAEVYTDPGPIMRGIFADEGWTIQGGGSCTYSIAPTSITVGSAATSGSVTLTTETGCMWTASSGNTGIATITSPPSGTGSATINYNVVVNAAFSQRRVNLTIGGQIFTITQNGTGPTMTLDRASLVFAGLSNGAAFTSVTGAQTVRMTQSGTGTVTWTATPTQPWIQVSPTSGSGSATFTISTVFAAGLTSGQAGTVSLNLSGAGNGAGPITVTLNSITAEASQAPFGSFDTPANGSTGIAGSIPLTGWALDDVEVTRVTICRDAATGETAPFDANCGGDAKIYIGDAVFVDGARNDIQSANPTLPLNSRASWGYLLLTNFLPSLGNGTFNFDAYAFDADGNTTLLGVKTITCANATSTAPFGAIDSPADGEIVGGSSFANFGWVLARGPNFADPPDGSTVQVFVDGTVVGSPSGWTNRSDLTGLFTPSSSYPGISNALGVFGLDTTSLTNGVHTIFWIATGTGGIGTSEIGSRFITVSNGSDLAGPISGAAAAPRAAMVIPAAPTLDVPVTAATRIAAPETLDSEIAAAPADPGAVQGRRGFDLARSLTTYRPASGRITVQAEELDRIELHLSGTSHHAYSGYLRTPSGLRPLPVGSTLDTSTGAFTWTPGVGFYGTYDLTFVRWSGGRAVARQEVRVALNAKGSNKVGPQTIIDAPFDGQVFAAGHAFFVGGWAADLDSLSDTGVDAVHVWAYPVDANGTRHDPQFIGPAIFGVARPDVAAVYGDRFRDSGYEIIVNGLAPGTYDLAVFAYSTVVNNFTAARVIRIIVR